MLIVRAALFLEERLYLTLLRVTAFVFSKFNAVKVTPSPLNYMYSSINSPRCFPHTHTHTHTCIINLIFAQYIAHVYTWRICVCRCVFT